MCDEKGIKKIADILCRSNGMNMEEAIRVARDVAKANTRTVNDFEWVTPKGAKIEATIVVEHITREIIDSDGFKIVGNCDEWRRNVENFAINGSETDLKELWNEHGIRCILYGRHGRDRLLVALPKNVEEAVYGEETEALKHQLAAAAESEKAYNDHYNMVMRALNT